MFGPVYGDPPERFRPPRRASQRERDHTSAPGVKSRLGASLWQSRRVATRMEHMADFFIGGEWVDAVAGGRREIRCPADGSLVATVAEGTAEDTEAAIAAARR